MNEIKYVEQKQELLKKIREAEEQKEKINKVLGTLKKDEKALDRFLTVRD